MKIHGRKTPQLGTIGPMGGSAPSEEAPEVEAPQAGSDRVNLSSTQRIKQLSQSVQAMPSVRIEKVEGLRVAIEEGHYHVESDELARKVVDEVLNEALLSGQWAKGAH
jgi:flagellar biosynthesis anti-sigma factor FlgM